jgi:hypothetical protein
LTSRSRCSQSWGCTSRWAGVPPARGLLPAASLSQWRARRQAADTADLLIRSHPPARSPASASHHKHPHPPAQPHPTRSGPGHAIGRPGRPGVPQVRRGGVDAGPRAVRRDQQREQLHRLPGAAAQHPVRARGPGGGGEGGSSAGGEGRGESNCTDYQARRLNIRCGCGGPGGGQGGLARGGGEGGEQLHRLPSVAAQHPVRLWSGGGGRRQGRQLV